MDGRGGRRRGRGSGPERPPAVPGYRVLGVLGTGGEGQHWRARGPDGADVAVRLLPPRTSAVRRAQWRRLDELRRATDHPNLARVLDVVRAARGTAVVSEVVEGPTLAAVRAARGPLSPTETAGVVAGLADGLAALHARGLAHGDVSPANVVVAGDRGPVLVDVAPLTSLHRGTPGFAAPERSTGGAATVAADVWSLAATARWCVDPAAVGALAAVLGPAVGDDPAGRGSAAALAARARRAAPGPLVVPTAPALAAGTLRAAHAVLPTAVVTRRRRSAHRRRPDRRRPWRDAAALVLGVGLVLVSAALLGVVPVGPADRAGDTARAAADSGSVGAAADVVAALVGARDRAIESGDAEALERLSRPGTAVAGGDAALLALLAAEGVRVRGLRTVVEDVALVRSAPGRAVVDVVLRQERHLRAGPDGAWAVVPAQPPRCVRMAVEDAGAGWRLTAAEACGGQPTSQAAASSMRG